MDFFKDIIGGIKDFFSSIGNFFSGGGFGSGGSSMGATYPTVTPYDNYGGGQGFVGPQMRPSPVADHSLSQSHVRQPFGTAASHYGQYPYNSPAFTAERDGARIAKAANRLEQTVLGAPFQLADGVVRGVSHEISRESAALNRQIRHDIMSGFGFGHGRR